MKTAWDYTQLADQYLKRPDYVAQAVDEMIKIAGVQEGDPVCDVGAGTAHLTKMLLDYGFKVTAVEPNDAMRNNGIEITKGRDAVWHEATGEETGQADQSFKLVTFGSSFNVTDRAKALKETARILLPKGWFACMWNHRDLEDPTQKQVEELIKSRVPEYQYGTRREDQTTVINESGLFEEVKKIEATRLFQIATEDYIEAWRSHATLQRQAGDNFENVVNEIKQLLAERQTIAIPYTTRIWMAQRR